MRSLLAPLLVLTVLVGAVLSFEESVPAWAQTVDEAEERADEATRRAEAADGLVDAAVAEREQLELELAASITRLNDLAAELSRVAATVDRLSSQIGYTDTELAGVEEDLVSQAVEAYMTALAMPGVSFVNSESVEEALVTGRLVTDMVSSGREQVGLLVVKRESLEELLAEFAAQQEEVARLRAEMEAETQRLGQLYARADTAVAEAIAEAEAADAAQRAAMDAVTVARAREEERRRQEERVPTTSPPSQAATTTSTTKPTTTSTTNLATPSTTSTTTPSTASGGSDSAWSFPPAVERWRDLVSAYFPTNRVDEALAIIRCESLGDPEAYNPYSGAGGLFQFLPSTWASVSPKAGFAGAEVFDPGPNIGTAAWLANRYQALGLNYWSAWSCRRVLG